MDLAGASDLVVPCAAVVLGRIAVVLGCVAVVLSMLLSHCHPPGPTPLTLYLQKVESGSDSDSKVDSDLEMRNATVDMTKSDSNSDSDSDVSVKKPPRGRKPGEAQEASSTTSVLLAGWREREAGGSWGPLLPWPPSNSLLPP